MKKMMNKMEKITRIIKKIQIKNILILIVLLVFNSYAWFIYATKVSSGLSAHITSWNVSFRAGENEITTNVIFEVDKIYPGMETQTKKITALNTGEMKAILSYEIKKIRILDKEYIVGTELSRR